MRRTAIVTGAARGIGRAVAIGLADSGFHVVCTSRTTKEGESEITGSLAGTVARIVAGGGSATSFRCDLTMPSELAALFQFAESEPSGRLELVVHAAMVRSYQEFGELTSNTWHETVCANLDVLYLLCRHSVDLFSSGGSIVCLSSRMADRKKPIPPGYVTYAIVKAATERLVTAIAPQLRSTNVAINAVRPGAVRTEYAEAELGPDHDWHGWREPESVIPAVRYLAKQRGSGVTGQIIEARDHHLGAVSP